MKDTLKYLLLAVLALLIGVGGAWAYIRHQNTLCTGVAVEIVGDADAGKFVPKQKIAAEVQKFKVQNAPLKSINTHKIEKHLSGISFLEHAECFITTSQENLGKQVLKVRIWPMEPVMRVFDGNKSFYLNKDGKRMPAVPDYFAPVPVVRAKGASVQRLLSLLPLMNYVDQNPELSDLVAMYDITDPKDLIISPSIYGHVVNFGTATDYESKFKKLLRFYDNVMPVKGWEAYDTVTVKWDYQVVATRRLKAIQNNQIVEDWDEQPDSIMVGMLNQKTDSASIKQQPKPKPAADASKPKTKPAPKQTAQAKSKINKKKS